MKLQNNTQTTYTHGELKLLPNGAVTEIKDEKVANIWLKIDGIVEYVAPEDVKKEVEALKAEIEKLKKENAELKKAAETAPQEVKKTTKKGK
jgi:hypothetical protein